MTVTTREQPDVALDGELVVCFAPRGDWDVYGGRASQADETAHMGNTPPGERGWLGNPHPMAEDSTAERRRVIAAFLADFLDRVESDAEFRDAVESLRGQRVACWCRGSCQERQPSNWCHLDVVHHWLEGDLGPVYEYLRTDEE